MGVGPPPHAIKPTARKTLVPPANSPRPGLAVPFAVAVGVASPDIFFMNDIENVVSVCGNTYVEPLGGVVVRL